MPNTQTSPGRTEGSERVSGAFTETISDNFGTVAEWLEINGHSRLTTSAPGADDIPQKCKESIYGDAVIEWRKNRVVTGAVLLAFLAVQLAIPITRLSSERGERFGWQMYSAVKPAPDFEVISAGGERAAIDLDDYVVSPRLDVDITGHLPQHLCTVIPRAVEVSWEVGSYRC